VEIRKLLRERFLDGHELRKEDEQKAQEIGALWPEIERFAKRGPVVDAGCGKGLLAIAIRLLGVDVVAIDRNEKLIERARKTNAGVDFVASAVESATWPQQPSLVVALHACGGATDAAIAKAIEVEAKAVLLVPCCYAGGPKHDEASEVAAQATADAWRAKLPLPDHGLVGRRFAQAIIDAERTLTLEAAGYETEVIEIWPPSTSPYNLLWRSRRVREPTRMKRAYEKLTSLRATPRDEQRG
jgi:SAM-dependent methyltransferase